MRKSVSRMIQTTRDIAASFEMQFGPKRGRSLQVAGASYIASAAAGMGKLAMGLVSLSLFTCVSAFYSFAMVVAKVVALSALVRGAGWDAQLRSCKLAGRLLVAASALYMLYSARLIWNPIERGFHLYVAIGIAAFTFFELGLNIRGVLVERRGKEPLFYALKTINLASACISLVLTQRALLALDGGENLADIHMRANVLMGLLMGGFALLLGVRLILRMKRAARGTNYAPVNRQLRRLAKRGGLPVFWRPAYLRDAAAPPQFGVYVPRDARPDDLACLCAIAQDVMKVELRPIPDAGGPRCQTEEERA